MADYNAGDVIATLKINATEWQRGLQQAQQQLQQFAQQAQRSLASVTPRVDTTVFQQGLQQAQQGLQQFAVQLQRSVAPVQPRVDVTAFTQGLQQAQQHLTVFAQQLQRSLMPVTPRVDTTAFQQGLQQAQQQLQQFSQQMARSLASVTPRVNLTTLQQALQQAQQQLQQVRQTQASSQQSTQQLTQAYQTLTQALNQQTQAYRGSTQAAQSAQQQHQAIAAGLRTQTAATQQASSAWQTMLSVAGGIGLATSIGAITSSLVALGRETVQTGARFEQFRSALSAIAGNAAAGQQQFQSLVATAQRLGVAFEPLAQGWRRLTAAASQTSLSVEAQQRLLTVVAVESRRVGTSTEELSRLMTGLGQVFSKGKLSMEELRQQIGEALPTAMAALARGMGRTTEELETLVSTGSIGAVNFAKAFTRGLEDIQKSSGTMADGFTQAVNRLVTSWKVFQDALANSGVNQYFATVLGNVQALVEAATGLVPQRPQPVQGPTPQGTPLSGGTDVQQKEIQRLQSLIDRYTKLAPAAQTSLMQETYAKQARAAQEQLDQLREAITLTENQAIAQTKVTEATNQTLSVKERQGEYEEEMRKKLDEVRKAQEAFRKEAELAPGLLGRPQGTPEEVQTYLKGQQQAIKKQLDELVTLAGAPPAGTQLTEALRKELAALDIQYAKLGEAIDASREKEQQRLKALREAEAERKRLLREAEAERERAVAQEISLTEDLARAKAFIVGKEETPAAQAQARVQVQGAGIQESIDKALLAFERSAALRELAPGLLQQFKDLKAALPGAIEAEGLKAFGTALQKDAIEPLENLREKIELTKEQRDLLTTAQIRAKYADNAAVQAAADLTEESIQTRIAYKEEVEALKERFTALKQNADAMREVEAAQDRLSKQIRQASMALLPEPETRRASTRLRREAELEGTPLTPDLEAQLETLDELEAQYDRVRYAAELWTDLASGVGNAWGQALQSVVDGTASVSEAFREMGRSILQTMAQIAQQEATRAFIRLGLGLLTGAATGAIAPAPTGGGGGGEYGTGIGEILGGGGPQPGGGTPFSFGTMLGGGGGAPPSPYDFGGGLGITEFQHGGIVNRPTRALIGERGPEAIFNKAQMQALFQLTPSAGGQAAGGSPVTIINVATKAQAEQEAASQRAMGREVIINEVLSELSKGESSSINRMIRTLAR